MPNQTYQAPIPCDRAMAISWYKVVKLQCTQPMGYSKEISAGQGSAADVVAGTKFKTVAGTQRMVLARTNTELLFAQNDTFYTQNFDSFFNVDCDILARVGVTNQIFHEMIEKCVLYAVVASTCLVAAPVAAWGAVASLSYFVVYDLPGYATLGNFIWYMRLLVLQVNDHSPALSKVLADYFIWNFVKKMPVEVVKATVQPFIDLVGVVANPADLSTLPKSIRTGGDTVEAGAAFCGAIGGAKKAGALKEVAKALAKSLLKTLAKGVVPAIQPGVQGAANVAEFKKAFIDGGISVDNETAARIMKDLGTETARKGVQKAFENFVKGVESEVTWESVIAKVNAAVGSLK